MLILLLTLLVVQRDMYEAVTVTEPIPLLIHCSPAERDGTTSFLVGFEGLRPVRILRDKDLHAKSKFWQSIGKQQQEIVAATQLVDALEKQDTLAARNAFASLAKSESALLQHLASEAPEKFKSYLQIRLDQGISERLKGAHLVIWNFRGKRVLAVYCPDNVTALYTKLLMNRVSGRGLAVCPKCGLPFVQKRPNQEYCSLQHREAHRVARWRASKTVKKGSK
jgi:hypothetical protein